MSVSSASSASSLDSEVTDFDITTMDQYLEYYLEVDNEQMREKVMAEGFIDLESLLKRDRKWVTQIRTRINKSTTGTPESKDMTTQHEEALWRAVLWAKYTYITQRQLDFAFATDRALDAVYEWFEGLEEELPDTTVATFTTKLNKRTWFESIESFLGAKKGKAGFPLTYVIATSGTLDPTIIDGGQGIPTFYLDLAARGRHNGFFFKADNNTVWRLLESKCRDTEAWHLIARHEPTKNGAGAYRTLHNQYMGEDKRRLLRQAATLIINNSKYDGRNRNYTLDFHISRWTQAFEDLGPDDAPSEARKVELFMNSWQVPGKEHLASIIRTNP